MRVPKIYLETTIFNFPIAIDAPQYQADTKQLFADIKEGKYIPFTSEYVTRELEAAVDTLREHRLRLIEDYGVKVIPASDEARKLAAAYINAGIIPPSYGTDAFHLAAATVAGLDFIVSLNFRHIVKRKTILETEMINFREGYKKIGIYSPMEVVDYAENL